MDKKIVPDYPALKLIFPYKRCSRCGGTGEYSYHQIHGTTCFKCNGRGYVWMSSKINDAVGRYCMDIERLRKPPAHQVKVGDLLLVATTNFPEAWRTVTSIEDDKSKIVWTFHTGLVVEVHRDARVRRSTPVNWRDYAREAGLDVEAIEKQLFIHYSSKQQ